VSGKRQSLKDKTVSGLIWSFSDTVAAHGVQFIFGIILARLLFPEDFGLIGMIAIVTAVSQSLIYSGLGTALIQKKEATQADYSTVFLYNLGASILLYIILYYSAGAVALFFNRPELIGIFRVISLGIIVNAFGIVQRTILTKRVDFKSQTKITILSAVISGTIAILLAYRGWGVWSLVVKMLLLNFLQTTLLWFFVRWYPSLLFSIESFRHLFGFGSKLLVSGLIDTIFRHVFHIIIGRFFSAASLGYYTRANQFSELASTNITGVIQRVTYPVLASIQDDPERLKRGYKKTLQATVFITFPLMLGMVAIAEPMVLLLIGDRWQQSIPYLQLLCFAGMLYPLHALNLNMILVKGRSDLFLKLEIVKKVMLIPLIVIAIQWGVIGLIGAQIAGSYIAYFINCYYSGRLIGYPMREQIVDILPAMGIAVLMAGAMHVGTIQIANVPFLKIIVQIIIGLSVYIGISKIIGLRSYTNLSRILRERLKVNNSTV
jgi:teichuronic acid exporter